MKQINVFNRSVFLKDILIASLIVVLPFLFYLYLIFPNEDIWNNDWFNFKTNYYAAIDVFFWTMFTKILTISLLIIWFITNKHWWRSVILVPLIIEFFKLFEVVNDEVKYFDEFEFIYSLPLTIPLIFLLFTIAKKLNYYSQFLNTNDELDKEISELLNELSLFKTENFKTIKKEFIQLRADKEQLPKEEYLKKLIALRNSLVQL